MPQWLWSRVEGSARPLAQDRESFLRLAQERQEAYSALSDVVLDTSGMGIPHVAFRLARLAQEMGGGAGTDRAKEPAWRLTVEGRLSRSAIEGGPGARVACMRERSGLAEEGAGSG